MRIGCRPHNWNQTIHILYYYLSPGPYLLERVLGLRASQHRLAGRREPHGHEDQA